MTWLVLRVLWLATTWLVYPNYQWVTETVNINKEIIQLYEDEQQRNFMAEQEEIIIKDYFLFLDKIWKIKYARWCMGEYTPATRNGERWVKCSSNAFDCAGLVKWYGIAKGIITAKEASYMNSQTIVLLGNKKDAILAQRGDFTSRQWFGDRSTGDLSTHFAVVSRDYTGGNILWIYDNVNGPNNNIIWERAIKVSYVRGIFYYMGKYRINVYTNGLVDTAREREITVDRRYDTDPKEEIINAIIPEDPNPHRYSKIIKWFDYDSDANKIASYRADNWATDYMIAKFKWESQFNVNALGKDWEHGLCQLMPNSTNLVWINDPRRNEGREFQAQVCLEKWNAVPDPDKIWFANAYIELKNIITLL